MFNMINKIATIRCDLIVFSFKTQQNYAFLLYFLQLILSLFLKTCNIQTFWFVLNKHSGANAL